MNKSKKLEEYRKSIINVHQNHVKMGTKAIQFLNLFACLFQSRGLTELNDSTNNRKKVPLELNSFHKLISPTISSLSRQVPSFVIYILLWSLLERGNSTLDACLCWTMEKVGAKIRSFMCFMC